MHYLIAQNQMGHKLVDFGETIAALAERLQALREQSSKVIPVIYSDAIIKSRYLTDDFGLPVVEDNGYMILMEDL